VILIKKYARQLSTKFGINVDQADKFPLRNPIRIVKKLEKELRFSEGGYYLELTFPFDRTMFRYLKKLRYSTRGTLEYCSADKCWYIYASPNNIKDFVKMAMSEGYNISPEVLTKFEEICKLDSDHVFTMQLNEDGIVVGAPKELASVLEMKTRGMTEKERIIYLVDRRNLYGYNLSAKMSAKARELLSDIPIQLFCLMFTHYPPELQYLVQKPEEVLTTIKEYSKLVNRDIVLFNRKEFFTSFNENTLSVNTNNWDVSAEADKSWDVSHFGLISSPVFTVSTRREQFRTDTPKQMVLCNLSDSNFEQLYLQKCAEGFSDRIICLTIKKNHNVHDSTASFEKLIYLNENSTIN